MLPNFFLETHSSDYQLSSSFASCSKTKLSTLQYKTTDVPDVALLSPLRRHRHWAINAEREALKDAVQLVDSLLELSRLDIQPRAQIWRRRWLDSVDVLLGARHRGDGNTMRDPTDEPSALSVNALAEARVLAEESASWDDLRRRQLDCDPTFVGSSRLRRQNALCGRAHSRWRHREDTQSQQAGNTGPERLTNLFNRPPKPSQRPILYSELLTQTPRRNRSRFGRDLPDAPELEPEPEPPQKLTYSPSWQEMPPTLDEPPDKELLPSSPSSPLSVNGSAESVLAASVANQNILTNVSKPPQTLTTKSSQNPNHQQPLNPSETSKTSEASKPSETSATSTSSEFSKTDEIQLIRNQLECPVCLDYLSPPIKQCANGHCVCSGCSPRLIHCATCRASFISTSNIVLENLVRSLLFPCRYNDSGCKEILKMDERPRHEQTCSFRPRTCPTACCDWQGLPHQLNSHVTSTHQHYNMELNEYKEFEFIVQRNDGVPTIVHDEQFVIFIDSQMFVFESHYDLWRSKFFAELRYVPLDSNVLMDSKRYAYDVELYTRNKNVHLKLRNLVDDERPRFPTAIKIDLDVFNQFVNNGQYALQIRVVSVEED